MGSNFDKVDAHVISSADFDEIPELTAEDFARGTLMIGGIPVQSKSGRASSSGAKQQLTLRLDPEVVQGFRATGPGWQARINQALREWLARQTA